MTIEDAINILNSLKQYYNDENQDGYVGFDDEDNEALDMAIKAIESQRWIPVSEPPKKSGEYLLDSEDFGIFVGEYDADMKGFGWWREDYEYDPDTIACIGREFIEFEGILAWMPLPQPYKESDKK